MKKTADKRRRPHVSVVFNRILRMTLVPFLKIKYRLHAENGEVVKRVRPPYLLLGNHACMWDPFLVNSLILPQVHYVVTDAQFRSRLLALGLSLVGSIPKTKTMSDMESMRNIMHVRDNGGIIGIFPEGQSCWDGHSLPIVHSTAKLAKLLKIPVITARTSGAYFSKPRWAKGSRRGRVNVRFDLAFTPGQLKAASADEIDRRIAELLENDEFTFNAKAGVKFVGSDRAEYLERALFVCPSCRTIGSLESHGNEFSCMACGYSVHYTLEGLFRPNNGALKFSTIRDWNLWQVEEFIRQLAEYRSGAGTEPFFTEEDVRVQIGYRSRPLAPFATGRLHLFPDRLEMEAETGTSRAFSITSIRGANVQNNEHWEFYSGSDLFRVTACPPRGCTYKWDLAVRTIQADEAKNRPAE